MHSDFELQIDSIERFMGYDSLSKNTVVDMVTKPLPKLDEKELEEFRLKLANQRKIYKLFLLFIISRLFVNISFSQIRLIDQVQITLSKKKVSQNLFFPLKYKPFIPVLNSIIELEKVVTQVLTYISFNSITSVSNKQNSIYSSYDIDELDEVEFNYTERADLNYTERTHVIRDEAKKMDNLLKKINYHTDIKDKVQKKKLNLLLNDKDLIKNFYKAFILNRPHLKKRKTTRQILKAIKRGEILKLISFVIRKLVKRRRQLWKHVNIIMPKVKFILIGKDYRIYKKIISQTYISQENKYFVNFMKKKN